MTEELPDVPDWIDEKIEFDPQKEVQDHHIVDIFQETDRPFLSRRRVQNELEMSDEGVRQRLLGLEEQGVLDECAAAGGRIYWIHDNRSDWPIPPDFDPEEDEESDAGELSVSDLTDRNDVRYGLLGMMAAMAASISITGAVVWIAFELGEGTVFNGMVVIGFFGAMFAVVFGGAGAATWLVNRVRGKSSNEENVM